MAKTEVADGQASQKIKNPMASDQRALIDTTIVALWHATPKRLNYNDY
jgi:hypothetical protein